MFELTPNDIRLNANAVTKDEAIRMMVSDMVQDDLVETDYLEGMRTREGQTSTFLGNGIAIPHGTPETRHLVKTTGIKVIRFPQGLDWGNGDIAHTIIGIAAKSDEHLSILRQLTHVITDDQLAQRLHTSAAVEEVISILNGQAFEPKLEIKPQAFRLNTQVEGIDEASALATSILRKYDYISAAEQPALMSQQPLQFADGIWLTTTLTEQPKPGLVVVANTGMSCEFQMLLALSTTGKTHKALFDRLLQMKRDQQLSQLTSAKTAAALSSLLKMTPIEGDSIELRLPIEHGLHARPAAQLAKLIKSQPGEVWVTNLDGDGSAVLGTSVARLINLGAAHGHLLRFTVCDSADSQSVLQALSTAVANGLGDAVAPVSDAQPTPVARQSLPAEPVKLQPGDVTYGLTGAPGMAAGKARLLQRAKFQFDETTTNINNALEHFERHLEMLINQVSEKLDGNQDSTKTKILAMHLELLNDPELIDGTKDLIRSGKTAEWAWTSIYQEQVQQLSQSNDPLLAERADDFRDLGYQLMLLMTAQAEQKTSDAHILICNEINPSQVADFDPTVVQAIVTSKGGTTSHAAILARAAGIPLLVGAGDSVLTIAEGSAVIVDCDNRSLTLATSDEQLIQAEQEIQRREADKAAAYAARFEPAISKDGTEIEVVANISAAADVAKTLENGGEGIGLFRSEFVYMAYNSEPSHEQQLKEYRAAREALASTKRPLIVRTLDVGGDKPLPYLALDDEENPFLGIRGARLSLLFPDMLRRQLRALLEAGKCGPVRIMFPMISDIGEWRQIKAIYQDIAAEYPTVEAEIGMMIEVPSAALMADTFAPELDFFSIGTNDLTQYTLAVDRGHAKLSRQADPMHPAVLRLIDMTCQAAQRAGIWVGVCGELAADPFAAKLLIGLGVSELSMGAKAIPMVKAAVRNTEISKAQALAKQALQAEDANAVYALKAQEATL